MKNRLLIPTMVAVALSMMALPAFASEITGSLTGGSGSSISGSVGTPSGGSLGGTVGAPSGGGSLSGTVGGSGSVSGTVGSGGGSSGGGGGSGSIGAGAGGGGSVLGNSTSNTPGSSVLGASTSNPNVPNTGAGGNAFANLLILLTSAAGMIFGAFYLRRPA